MKLNDKRFFTEEGQTRDLYEREELEHYLEFRNENDMWISCYINDLAAVGVPNLPLFFPSNCQNIEVKRSTYAIPVEDIDYELLANDECIRSTGIFLVIPYNGKMTPFPTRWTAYNHICQRTDDYCGTMIRFDEKTNKSVLPVDEKAQRLTRDFELYSDRCNILYRDSKISAVLSKEYVILPADELIEVLETKLREEHPELRYMSGQVNNEYLMLNYELNDRAMEEQLRLQLNDHGSNINTLKAGVQFSTSDVGLSSVCANIYFECDGIKMFLDGIKMPHKGANTSIPKFCELMDSFGMILKECENRIEELGNMDINNVAFVIQEIADSNPGIFPTKVTGEVLEDVSLKCSEGGTGIDVYLGLNDIITRHNSENKLSPTRYLQLTEQVVKLIKLPFDKIDSGEVVLKKKDSVR